MPTESATPSCNTEVGSTSVPTLTYSELTFSDGTKITLNPQDIVVFVGPNNAGKCAALRELEFILRKNRNTHVIKSAGLLRLGSEDEVDRHLRKHAVVQHNGRNEIFNVGGHSIGAPDLPGYWSGSQFEPLIPFFLKRISTENRINDSNPAQAIDVLYTTPQHPIHTMYLDEDVERKIDSYFFRAFGTNLILFRLGGSVWPLLVGERESPNADEDRLSASYNKRMIEKTTPLSDQGDGMRSFASIIMHLLVPSWPSILILDEPEVYLHPPQARLLGEIIASERVPTAQLFVATHSPDVLRGILDTNPDNLRIVRIERNGDINNVRELQSPDIKNINSDSLMRYSDVLSGIFHRRAIICESDADCMFYSSILHASVTRGKQNPDVLFLHAGGKHRMSTLAHALNALGVRVDVIADIDILNDIPTLKRIVSSLGGEWLHVANDARVVKLSVEHHKPWLNSLEITKAIRIEIEKAPNDGEFPRDIRNRIEKLFRKASPWDAVKASGVSALPSGQAIAHYQSLQKVFKNLGLWIVPCGELEGFCKAVGGHGPNWTQKVLENYDVHTSDELGPARMFVGEIWDFKRH